MLRSLTQTVRRSLVYYRKDSVNLIIIIALLTAVITGSLLTGYSVRTSLKANSGQKLGNTSILISSGLRFFDILLAERISDFTGEGAAAILETDGYCQNFSTGMTALNVRIYGITDEFWSFQGKEIFTIPKGSVAINSVLAQHLQVQEGDEVIIKFRDTDPLPENAPFAPSRESGRSGVLKVAKILQPDAMGNFSLGVSQVNPSNIFMNIEDISNGDSERISVNRILLQNNAGNSRDYFNAALTKLLEPSDIGLTIRRSEKTGETELISDRIFIDSTLVSEIRKSLPSARLLISYLGNEFRVDRHSTPYSFITASDYGNLPEKGILINSWMASDLNAGSGDTLTLKWYDPGFGNRLEEKSMSFIISGITGDDHLYADPSLMPEFPGISGSATCSSWDAGVPLLMDRIRDKDEEYWNKYGGTPKAFINYETGVRLWGNNFGPATAIRFPSGNDPDHVRKVLSGSIDPFKAGFSISDVRKITNDAASGGTDFSTLFLSLSVFMIVSCLILLSMAVSMFFDSRRKQVSTLYALGFRNKQIRNLLLSETFIISSAGALPGILIGCLFNALIIMALNSVWKGAVQTDTLTPYIDFMSLFTGFTATIIIAAILLTVKSRNFLRSLSERETGKMKIHSRRRNMLFILLSLMIVTALLLISLLTSVESTAFTFMAGAALFCAMILILRHSYLRYDCAGEELKKIRRNPVRKFYMFNPGHGLTPAIFIAAGIFAVIITGANRQVINEKKLLRTGGTGGFLLWAESAIPVRENVGTREGRSEFGLDEDELKELIIVPAKRLPGDDASCLNLNHITAPPLLGIVPEEFISRSSFSFATELRNQGGINPWSMLSEKPSGNTIYGIADQTVLEWGLKIKTGDTLVYRAENGQILNIVIYAGLKSSVFQGYLLIGAENFDRFFPSITGTSIFLADGNANYSEFYIETLSQRFTQYGLSVMPSGEKLASFFVVTNTYLDVFMILGIFGMILGVAGLGFVLTRNFNQRIKEFALLAATGYTIRQIRMIILNDHFIILLWGIVTGVLSGLVSTLQSLRSGYDMPWLVIAAMTGLIIISGVTAVYLSVRRVTKGSLIIRLRSE